MCDGPAACSSHPAGSRRMRDGIRLELRARGLAPSLGAGGSLVVASLCCLILRSAMLPSATGPAAATRRPDGTVTLRRPPGRPPAAPPPARPRRSPRRRARRSARAPARPPRRRVRAAPRRRRPAPRMRPRHSGDRTNRPAAAPAPGSGRPAAARARRRRSRRPAAPAPAPAAPAPGPVEQVIEDVGREHTAAPPAGGAVAARARHGAARSAARSTRPARAPASESSTGDLDLWPRLAIAATGRARAGSRAARGSAPGTRRRRRRRGSGGRRRA